jgi:hypothetical protein
MVEGVQRRVVLTNDEGRHIVGLDVDVARVVDPGQPVLGRERDDIYRAADLVLEGLDLL